MTSFPKPRPAALERDDRRKARAVRDEAENKKVRARSAGRCEMNDGWGRCRRRAIHVHHKLGGFGVRGRGASALASNKLNLCPACHSDIHNHVLVPDGNTFTRVK